MRAARASYGDTAVVTRHVLQSIMKGLAAELRRAGGREGLSAGRAHDGLSGRVEHEAP